MRRTHINGGLGVASSNLAAPTNKSYQQLDQPITRAGCALLFFWSGSGRN
jgi:hypothetical protein